ncbi:type II toxin-antitoxin system RelE/ParE family toxin [Pseudomonas sp. CR3202]|uniref:type II toxin-antitoxin system RelE/ParE family toxin n=1 Tax=Pseudomonas sp. CR3202 TaxID=3351532 RepID=UPI003BF02458
MSLKLLQAAEIELAEAVAWYEEQAPGLGDAFLIELVRVFRLIEHYPDAWHSLSQNTRRCRLARFPYGVIYAQDGDDLLVLAIAHLHRAPEYWRDRRDACR